MRASQRNPHELADDLHGHRVVRKTVPVSPCSSRGPVLRGRHPEDTHGRMCTVARRAVCFPAGPQEGARRPRKCIRISEGERANAFRTMAAAVHPVGRPNRGPQGFPPASRARDFYSHTGHRRVRWRHGRSGRRLPRILPRCVAATRSVRAIRNRDKRSLGSLRYGDMTWGMESNRTRTLLPGRWSRRACASDRARTQDGVGHSLVRSPVAARWGCALRQQPYGIRALFGKQLATIVPQLAESCGPRSMGSLKKRCGRRGEEERTWPLGRVRSGRLSALHTAR